MQIHEDFQQHGNWFPSMVVWVLPCFALITTVCCWNWPRENITKSKMVGIILFAFGVGYLVMVLHQTGEDNGGTLPFSVGCGSAQKTLVCQALRGYGVGPWVWRLPVDDLMKIGLRDTSSNWRKFQCLMEQKIAFGIVSIKLQRGTLSPIDAILMTMAPGMCCLHRLHHVPRH